MLRKLFRARVGGRSPDSQRRLDSLVDLQAGDLVTFKHRLALPPSVQGQTFEVSAIATYQFEDGLHPQLTLAGAEAGRIYLGFRANDPAEMSLSRNAPRADVLRLFDEDAFSALWDDDFADLEVAAKLPEYEGWLAGRYAQIKKWAEGYYYDRDCRGEELSSYADDGSEEFRYHECEDASGHFGLTVEVWGDGDTEVSLDIDCSPDVIEAMWPGEQ